jgi:hypothetical protein
MSHQCPFPVHTSDTRRCYRTGSVPGFTFSLTLVAILLGYAGLSDAAPTKKPSPVSEIPAAGDGVVGYAKGRLLVAPRAGLSEKEFAKILKSRNRLLHTFQPPRKALRLFQIRLRDLADGLLLRSAIHHA